MEQPLPLIGRDSEIRRLAALLGRVAPGRPAVLVVDGPLDSGRSRLLREIAAVGRKSGAAVAVSRECVILVRDRSEPINPADLDRLVASAPVLVVTTGMPISTTAMAEVHRIRLAPLASNDVRRLITSVLGVRPDDMLLDLARVAAGQPAAVLDLLAGLREEDLLRIVDGTAVLMSARLPARTRARLTDRLVTLSPPARHLMQAATALESPFLPARLSALLSRRLVTLLPDLEEALESGLLVTAGNALSFSHDLVRPIIEASMPRAVVTALRQQQGRDRPRVASTRNQPRREPPRTVDWALPARSARASGRGVRRRRLEVDHLLDHLGELRADLPAGEAFGIQRQHDLIHARQPPLPLLDDRRGERGGPIPRHLDVDLAGVLGYLFVERGLHDRLGQPLEQPVRTVSDSPCSLASRTSSAAALASGDGSGFFFREVTSSSVVIARHLPRRALRPAGPAGKHVRSTVPSSPVLGPGAELEDPV